MIRREYRSIDQPFSDCGKSFVIEFETDDFYTYKAAKNYIESMVQTQEETEVNIFLEGKLCEHEENEEA